MHPNADRITEAQGLIQQHLTEDEELGSDRATADHRAAATTYATPPKSAHTFHVAVPDLARLATVVATVGTELAEWSMSAVYWDARGRTDGEGVDLYFHVDVSDPLE